MEELKQKVKDPENVLVDGWDYHYNGEDSVPTLEVPAKPSEQEWIEHQVTHAFPKFWCKHCLMGRGARPQHITNVFDVEPHEGGPNTFSIDHRYLSDGDGKEDQPQLVMVDHNHGRVFCTPVACIASSHASSHLIRASS